MDQRKFSMLCYPIPHRLSKISFLFNHSLYMSFLEPQDTEMGERRGEVGHEIDPIENRVCQQGGVGGVRKKERERWGKHIQI